MHNKKNRWRILIVLLGLSACAHPAEKTSGGGSGTYKVGAPYQVSGIWYYPHEDFSYDETGIASWYGQSFHMQRTANGEIFNKNELTAAHKTLPLPTLARVTNLENGRSIVVRINDRGPFSGSRLIDMSERGAQLLGFEKQGTAKVRVQVLADESKAIADAMRHYGGGTTTSLVSNSLVGEAPPPQSAALVPVSSQAIEEPSPESAQLEPIKTTPQIHQALLSTRPVPEVVQMRVSGSNQIFIQAGAFTVLENATKLQQKLASVGHVEVSNTILNGSRFYRVRVGPIKDVVVADRLMSRVSRLGAPHPRIIID